MVEKGILNPDGLSNQDQYLDSIKQDLQEWDENFRSSNEVYKKFVDLHSLYEQFENGQVILNDDEKLHSDLQKLINKHNNGPTKVNTAKYLEKEIKAAKTTRDHNRTGTTKLRLELKRAQESARITKKPKNEIKKVGNRYYQYWSTPNTTLAGKYQTDRAKPRDVYLQIRYTCVEEPETIEHAKMVRKIKQYKEALPDEPCEEVFKKFLQDRLDLIEKVKTKETYTKGFLLKTVATILSPEDNQKVKAYLQTQEHSRSMSYLADAIRMARLQQAHERSGKEGLVSLNTKSKEFQNHFAATQSYYERTRSGFAGVKRQRSGQQRGRRNNNQNQRWSYNNSGNTSNTNQRQNSQGNQNSNSNQNSYGNGFTKGRNKRNNRNNNGNNSGNNTNNQRSGNNSNNQSNASRGQNQNGQNGPHCKLSSPTVIPKYDTQKIPQGLSNWADQKVDPKVRQLMMKHFEAENIEIKTPPKGIKII